MYLYLYDSFLKDRKYAPLLAQVENRLTDFGISGKIVWITTFTNPRRIIEDELRWGRKTVVVVGNDETIARVLGRAADMHYIFGCIPVGAPQEIATLLGVPAGVAASEVLAKRRVEKIDVGKVNDTFFLQRVSIASSQCEVECEGKYTLSTERTLEVEVCNLGAPRWVADPSPAYVHPQDGRLAAFVRPVRTTLFGRKVESASMLPVRTVTVRAPRPFDVVIDGRLQREVQLTITVARTKLAMIVGKERKF